MSIKLMIGLGSTTAGIAFLAVAAEQGLAYNELTDPGALNAMVDFGIVSLIFLLVPAALIIAWIVREARREIARSGFTPAQVALGEAVVMGVAHHEWSRHNQERSAELTASVMGLERGAEGPWG